MATIRALNLGGWLVIEKWMTPSLFHEIDAEDEYNLLRQLKERKEDIIQSHRDTFITKEDFKWISDYGIDTVRLPVGHWVLEAKEPYIKAVSYVDKAFEWAKEYGLKIMLDMHAAPGCQNGFDNGGLSGICLWHTKQEYIDETVEILKQLAMRYKDHEALGGIQVLNEPRWDINLSIIQSFYIDAYKQLRQILNKDHYIVFHDAFRLHEWNDFFKDNSLNNVMLDTHMYQVFSANDKLRSMNEIIHKGNMLRHKELKDLPDNIDIIVGEWSIGLPKKVKQEANNPFILDALYRAVGNSLLVTFEQVYGWVFWNYNLEYESKGYHSGWSFRYAVEAGWLPKVIDQYKE